MTSKLFPLSRGQNIRWLVHFAFRRNKLRVLATIIPFAPLGFLAFALAGREVINGLIEQDLSHVLIAVSVMGAAIGLTQALGYWQYVNGTVQLVHLAHQELDSDLFDIVSQMHLEDFEKAETLDRLEILRVERGPITRACLMLSDIVFVLTVLVWTTILLMIIDLRLGILILATVPMVWIYCRTESTRNETQLAIAEHRRMAFHLFDIGTKSSAAKELRVLGQEDKLKSRYIQISQQITTKLTLHSLKINVIRSCGWVFYCTLLTGVLYAVIYHPQSSTLTSGELFLVLLIISYISEQVTGMADTAAKIGQTLRLVEHLLFLSTRSNKGLHATGLPSRLTTGLQLCNVSFAYPNQAVPALEDINVVISPGRVVAIVGENGSGKSTLVNLLCGLYLPTSGNIYVDDTPMEDLRLEDWFRHLSVVCQDFAKFEFLLRETVGVGKLEAINDTLAVSNALEQAQGSPIAKQLPAGLETKLGTADKEVDLSNGQWQKLAIARGMMRHKPLVVIFDEPTASLDAIAEQQLLELYIGNSQRRAYDHGTIVVIVSHRYSTARWADDVLVLHKGRIAEQGTHEELLSINGLYANLYRRQSNVYNLS